MKAQAIRSLGIFIIICGVVTSAGGQQPTRAAGGEQTRTVDSVGLDASRLDDAEILYRRIRTAAHSACAAQQRIWDVKKVLHRNHCVEEAVAAAVARVDEPVLTTIHQAFDERLAGR